MHVAVLGAGTMGRGIAGQFVREHRVTLRDVDPAVLDEARTTVAETLAGSVEHGSLADDDRERALERLTTTTDLAALAGADLLVEAVPEDLELKREVLAAAEPVVADDAVVATNTSSLSVTAVTADLDRPERALGLHFFNPVHLMALVEVVVGAHTAEATVERAVELVEALGKEPVVVRDSAGFATSRLGLALGLEAIRMVETGVAGPREVDRAMELGYDHPVGPVELGDVVGLDVRLEVAEYLREQLGERFRPPQSLRQKVRAGELGRKTGRGFYVWDGDERVGVADDWGTRA
jgi:3-hydroxybutyryl-CoA dehydrogenase